MTDRKVSREGQGIALNNIENVKTTDINVDHSKTGDEGHVAPQMRTKSDDLTVWESIKQYKLVTLVAMGAAFSASLDGYRKYIFISLPISSPLGNRS